MIRDRQTGQLFQDDEWRRWLLENGGPSFEQLTSEIIEQLGADPVFEGPHASLGRYQVSQMQGVIQREDGKWYTNWVAVDLEDEAKQMLDEQQAESIRRNRNQKLQETDWLITKSLELGQSVPSNVSQYRQALRDIPSQSGFPWDVVWPTL